MALAIGCGGDDTDTTGSTGSGAASSGGSSTGTMSTTSGGGGDMMCGPYPTPETITPIGRLDFCELDDGCMLEVGDCDAISDAFLFNLTAEQNMANVVEVGLQITNTDDYVVSATQGDVRFNQNPGNWVECDGNPTDCDSVIDIPVDTETTVVTNRHTVTFTYNSADETYTLTEFAPL